MWDGLRVPAFPDTGKGFSLMDVTVRHKGVLALPNPLHSPTCSATGWLSC